MPPARRHAQPVRRELRLARVVKEQRAPPHQIRQPPLRRGFVPEAQGVVERAQAVPAPGVIRPAGPSQDTRNPCCRRLRDCPAVANAPAQIRRYPQADQDSALGRLRSIRFTNPLPALR